MTCTPQDCATARVNPLPTESEHAYGTKHCLCLWFRACTLGVVWDDSAVHVPGVHVSDTSLSIPAESDVSDYWCGMVWW